MSPQCFSAVRVRRRSAKTDSQWLRVALAAAGLGVTLILAAFAARAPSVLYYVGAALALIGVYVACAVLILPLPLPQLLADRRARVFQQRIDAFLVEGRALNARPVTDEAGRTELEAAYADWVERTQTWLSRNVSAADAAAFQYAIGRSVDVLGSYDQAHNELRLKLSWQLQVLQELRAREV
jgi:hypothetical protein